MTVEPGSIALISGGPAANLGKIVFVVGCPDDPRLPRVGGAGTVWDVQMIATPPLGLDGEEYLRIGIGEDWLTSIPVPTDLAAEMRECGLANLLERAIEEMLHEDFGDDGAATSAGAECQRLVDGGDMTDTSGGTRQQHLSFDYGTAAARDVAEKARQLLINNRFIMSGDAGLQNVWEEIVIQEREGRTPVWEAYEAAMRDAVFSAMMSLCPADRTALWLKTDPGRDWRYDQDDESDATIEPPVDDEDIAMYIMKEWLLHMADDFTNTRIEKFLYRGDDDPGDMEDASDYTSDEPIPEEALSKASLEVEPMKVPDKFPPGCMFLASFSGDDFVVFPDGKVFVLDDSGKSLRERSGLPRGAAPMSEANFLNSAKSNVAFMEWKLSS